MRGLSGKNVLVTGGVPSLGGGLPALDTAEIYRPR